jgi:hypothetical protein
MPKGNVDQDVLRAMEYIQAGIERAYLALLESYPNVERTKSQEYALMATGNILSDFVDAVDFYRQNGATKNAAA